MKFFFLQFLIFKNEAGFPIVVIIVFNIGLGCIYSIIEQAYLHSLNTSLMDHHNWLNNKPVPGEHLISLTYNLAERSNLCIFRLIYFFCS